MGKRAAAQIESVDGEKDEQSNGEDSDGKIQANKRAKAAKTVVTEHEKPEANKQAKAAKRDVTEDAKPKANKPENTEKTTVTEDARPTSNASDKNLGVRFFCSCGRT